MRARGDRNLIRQRRRLSARFSSAPCKPHGNGDNEHINSAEPSTADRHTFQLENFISNSIREMVTSNSICVYKINLEIFV